MNLYYAEIITSTDSISGHRWRRKRIALEQLGSMLNYPAEVNMGLVKIQVVEEKVDFWTWLFP